MFNTNILYKNIHYALHKRVYLNCIFIFLFFTYYTNPMDMVICEIEEHKWMPFHIGCSDDLFCFFLLKFGQYDSFERYTCTFYMLLDPVLKCNTITIHNYLMKNAINK